MTFSRVVGRSDRKKKIHELCENGDFTADYLRARTMKHFAALGGSLNSTALHRPNTTTK